jgi:hypothetical protein
MLDENWITAADDHDDFAEELALEFDGSQDPDAVWEWDGQSWVPCNA